MGLGFLHAAALWLAAGAVVPLLIHLLMKRRPREQLFPAVRFVEQSRRESRRKIRLRQLLLLALRVGAVAFFAIVIARPFLRSGAEAAPGQVRRTPVTVVVLDDTLSMRYRWAGTSPFERARSKALELIEALPQGTACALVTLTRPTGDLTTDRSTLARRLQNLRARTAGATCRAALERGAELLRQTEGRRTLVVCSDMSVSSWSTSDAAGADLGEGVELLLVDCGALEPVNAGVVALDLVGEPPVAGARVAVKAAFKACGAEQARSVEFRVDGRVVDRRQVRLVPGAEHQETFQFLLESPGHHWVQVGFLNPDGLPEDDSRCLALDVAESIGVLIVEQPPQGAAEAPSRFLRLALNPWPEPQGGIFRLRTCAPEALESQSLAGVDVVAVFDPSRLPGRAWERLNGFVEAAGAVVVFADSAPQEAYPAPCSALPAKVGPAVDAPSGAPWQPRIVSPDHPLVEALRRSGADIGGVRVWRCRRVDPAEGAQELVALGPDLPLLVLREMEGRAAFLAVGADGTWSSLPRSVAFVPLMQELFLHLAGKAAGRAHSYLPGAQVRLTFDPAEGPATVYVTPPGTEEPERVPPAGSAGRVVYWRTEQPGYYRVEFRQAGRRRAGGFAVNAPAAESDLTRVAPDRLQAVLGADKAKVVSAEGASVGFLTSAGASGELTPLVALLVLALLGAEGLLLAHYHRRAGNGSKSK